MLNQVAAAEATYSATYVENYLDSVENLPNDVQRHLTRIREIDLQYRAYLRDVDYYYDQWTNCSTNELESTHATSKRARAMARIQQSLIAAQELGDDKLQVVTQLQEMLDLKTRQLDGDFKNLEYVAKDDPDLIEPLPKETRSVSPTLYVPSSTTSNPKSSDPRPEESIATTTTTAGFTSTTNNNNSNDRVNNATASNTAANANSINSNINGDRWKRSRRARNENATLHGNTSNNTSTASKTSQADATVDSSTTNANHSKTNAATSAQQTAAVGGTNTSNVSQNKKQSANSGAGVGAGKKRKRKSARAQSGAGSATSGSNNGANGNQNNTRSHDDTPPLEETIDPDEPTYCLCDQISFGEMILCDNDLCPIEWFHFSCVSLTTKPKGKWFCPNCRGDRPSVMKPKQQFLKELERYNREKEEKT